MSKIHAYEPLNGFKNYSSPTTKPLKNGVFVYHEKEWTLQEQIAQKLEKIAHFIDILFSQSATDHSESVSGRVQNNIEMLHRDLESLQISLKTNPFDFNVDNLQITENWIEEMRAIADDSKSQISDKNELKILKKLSHTLTELDHLIKPKTIVTQPIQPVRTTMTASLTTKKTATTAAKKTAHKPVKKVATAKKKTAAKTTKRPAAKAKPAKTVAKTVKKVTKVAAPKKKTTAVKKVVSKTSKPKAAAKKTVHATRKVATAKKAATKVVRKPAAKAKKPSMSR